MSGLAMMPWFPGDFMKSTRGWSITAKGVYRELLDAQWDICALPADPHELRALIAATEEEWSIGWKRCEPKFPVDADGLRRNRRLEEHRADSQQRRENARKHGLAGANGRWKNGPKGTGRKGKNGVDARALPEQSESTAGEEPEEWPQASSPTPSPTPSPSPSPSPAQAQAAQQLSRTRARTRRERDRDPEAAQLAATLREYKVEIKDDDPHLRQWIDSITIERLIATIAFIRFQRDDFIWPRVIWPSYLNKLALDPGVLVTALHVTRLHQVMRGEIAPDEHLHLPPVRVPT